MELQDYLDAAGNIGMGALETVNAPFQVAGEAIRGASESEPLQMASASDPSGFRWPSIVQRLAPSTRTEEPPADPFMKAYQGLEGLVNLPQGTQAASDVVTNQPDIAAQLGGLGMSLGVMPPTVKAASEMQVPDELMNERGNLTLGPGDATPPPAASPWFSRLENTLQAKLPEKADVGQIKNIISTLPKEEVDWRGLNDFLEQKHGQIPKADVMEQLKQNPVDIGETTLAGKPSDYRRPARTINEDEDLPQEVIAKAEQLRQEEGDRALEDFYWEPGDGYGTEPIDMTQENIEHGTGQKDLWGKEIQPLPEKHMVMYGGDPVMHDDLPQYWAARSTPDEEGHAIFPDEDSAREAYYEYIQDDEMRARDEAYRQWENDHPVEDFYEDAKNELGYVPPEEIEEPEQLPAGPGAGPTKFESYSTPGGTNYREVLMTLPGNGKDYGSLDIMNMAKDLAKESGEDWDNLGPNGRQQFERTASNMIASKEQNFRSGHWDEPNVLAHIRLKDFADPATGKKTLLVDEIQSDWHQRGRAKGYKTPLPPPAPTMDTFIVEQTPDQYIVKAEGMKPLAIGKGTVDSEYNAKSYASQYWQKQREEMRANQSMRDMVPNAPFKKNWQELAFKRALQEAVAGGYDEMAWTTGEQQADRYSLAKQVNTIDVQPVESADPAFKGNKVVEIQLHGGGNIHLGVNKDGVVQNTNRYQNELNGKSLDEIVGKEMAQKIMAGTGEISGEGLKVGGEGMKGFYDKILPDFANKYLKKYGVKVGETAIPTKPGLVKHNPEAAYEKVHSIPITPEMKADILGKGQPMWQVPAMIGAGAAAAAGGQDQKQYAQGGVVQEEAMPFQSQAQRGFMYANHPKIAKRFEAETPKGAKLPERVKKMNKGGVAGDWRSDLAGYMNEHFANRKSPQYMFTGGMSGDDGDHDDPANMQSTLAPQPPASLSAPPPAPVFNPSGGLPPPAAPPPMMLPPAVAPSGQDGLPSYLAQQQAMLNKYGPEDQMALEQAIQKQRTGLVPNLALAGTGLADAIMQGVARAGPSNFQSNLQNRLDKNQEGQRQALEHAQTANLARMKQQMELATYDKTSPISRMTQRSNTPLLTKLGYTPEQIAQVPASVMPEITKNELAFTESQGKIQEAEAVHELMAGIQGKVLAENHRKNMQDALDRKAALEQHADEVSTAHPGVTIGKALIKGAQKMLGGGSNYTPDVLNYASAHNITPAAAQAIKNKRMGAQ